MDTPDSLVAREISYLNGKPLRVYVFKSALRPEYKIGITTNVAHRLATVSIQVASRLECVLSFHGSRRDEAALHAAFADERVGGEWFRESARLLAWIERQREVR